MLHRGNSRRGPDTSAAQEIKLVNMKTEAYEEFYPIYKSNPQLSYSDFKEDSFKTLVREKFKNSTLPLSLRKRKIYENYCNKQELVELKMKEDNIFDYLNSSLRITDLPIVMRKHLLSEKIKKGVNFS